MRPCMADATAKNKKVVDAYPNSLPDTYSVTIGFVPSDTKYFFAACMCDYSRVCVPAMCVGVSK